MEKFVDRKGVDYRTDTLRLWGGGALRSLFVAGTLLLAATMLSGCASGGGGGLVACTPAPPPTPPPPPPPPPPQSPASASATPVAMNGPPPQVRGPWRDNSFTVAHDAVNDVYVLTTQGHDGGLTAAQATLGPLDLVAGPEPSNFSYYRPAATPLSAPPVLTLLRNAPDNTRIVLSYLSYGIWNVDASHALAFLTGSETSSADVPRTGSATYHGVVDGFFGGSRLLGSTGALTADFATGAVTTTLSLHANGLSGSLSGTGTIGAGTSRFDGLLTGTLAGNDAGGHFLGGFYGPGASEAGYAFVAADDWIENVAGVFVGGR
jgi:hypothetical protein